MSTLQAVNAAHTTQQNAAQLWTPAYATTSGSTFYLSGAGIQPVAPAVEAKPQKKKKLSPLEWLDEQVNAVVGLAIP